MAVWRCQSSRSTNTPTCSRPASTSLAIVNVLMRLEEQFDIELPDDMLQRKSFSSIATIDSVVTRLSGQVAHT